MTKRLKAVVLGFGIGLGTVAVAQPVQQPPYQAQMPSMNQGMTQARSMMNNPEMRTTMSRMGQTCERMMSNMPNDMARVPSNRR